MKSLKPSVRILRRISLLLIAGITLFAGCDLLGPIVNGDDPDPPDAPFNVQLQVLSSTQIRINWESDGRDLDGFVIRRRMDQTNFQTIGQPGKDDRFFIDGTLDPETEYFYQIQATGPGGESEFTPVPELSAVTLVDGGMPAFLAQDTEMYPNQGTLGNNIIELLIPGQQYDVEIMINTLDWLQFPVQPNGDVYCELDEFELLEGENSILFRYRHPDTGQTGDAGELIVHRGFIDLGRDFEDSGFDIPQVRLQADVVNDGVFTLYERDPMSSDPYAPVAGHLLIPHSDGSMAVANGGDVLLGLELESASLEYAYLALFNYNFYTQNFELAVNTGASLSGALYKIVNNVDSPLVPGDGADFISVLSFEDGDGNRIYSHPGIQLDGSHPDFDPSTGDFIFEGLSGGHDYHLETLWNSEEYHMFWREHPVPVSGNQDVGTWYYDLDRPVILIQHHGWGHYDWVAEMNQYVSDNTAAFGNIDWIRNEYREFDEIVNILSDNSHPLHGKTVMTFTNYHIDYGGGTVVNLTDLITSGRFRELGALGIVEADYQPAYQHPSGFYGMPFYTGNHLMLYYNSSLISQVDVPINSAELLALDPSATPAGSSHWLAYNYFEPFWLIPWITGSAGFPLDAAENKDLNTAEMINALGFVDSLLSDGILAPDTDYTAADDMFRNGEVPMIINGDWTFDSYREHFGPDLGVAALPALEAPSVPFTESLNFYIVDRGDPSFEQALADMLLALQDETAIESAYAGVTDVIQIPRIPALLLTHDNLGDALYQDMVNLLPADNPLPRSQGMDDAWQAMLNVYPDFLNGTLTATEAAAAMQAY